jgi:hypothetical protein
MLSGCPPEIIDMTVYGCEGIDVFVSFCWPAEYEENCAMPSADPG